MEDDLLIDREGSPSPASAGARKRLAQSPGAWKLLSTPSELLLALRERSDGLLTELAQFHPKGAVLAGDLAEMQPSDLLNFLHQGRRTGVLLSRSDGTERALVMVEGNVAWAVSTSPGERLGELLSRMGLAERAKVDVALAKQGASRKHKRLGQVLVDEKVISPDVLSRGLRLLVTEVFLGLLVARAGSFVFLRGIDQAALPALLLLDTQAMLLDGLRRLDEMELYRTLIPTSDVAPRTTGNKPREAEITPEGSRVFALADGVRTIADIASATALGEFEATKAAYKLVERGFLRL